MAARLEGDVVVAWAGGAGRRSREVVCVDRSGRREVAGVDRLHVGAVAAAGPRLACARRDDAVGTDALAGLDLADPLLDAVQALAQRELEALAIGEQLEELVGVDLVFGVARQPRRDRLEPVVG